MRKRIGIKNNGIKLFPVFGANRCEILIKLLNFFRMFGTSYQASLLVSFPVGVTYTERIFKQERFGFIYILKAFCPWGGSSLCGGTMWWDRGAHLMGFSSSNGKVRRPCSLPFFRFAFLILGFKIVLPRFRMVLSLLVALLVGSVGPYQHTRAKLPPNHPMSLRRWKINITQHTQYWD